MDQPTVLDFLLQKKKILIIISVIIVLLLMVMIFFISSYRKPTIKNDLVSTPNLVSHTSTGYPFKSQKFSEGYQVGKVTVTLNDLNSKYQIYFPDNPASRQNLDNWQKVASLVNQDAILQDEYLKTGLYVSSSSNSNINPRLVTKAREYFDTQGTTYISGEVLSIWFYNTTPPLMGVEAAKNETKKIIEDLRDKVIQGQYTIKQAADAIAAMSNLKEIDSAYKTNSYASFTYLKPSQFKFNDHDLDRQMWQMQADTISPILVGKDFDGEKWYDAYYVVVKITDKKTTLYNSTDDLINKKIQEGEKISL